MIDFTGRVERCSKLFRSSGAPFSHEVRALTEQEIRDLTDRGNTCLDWSGVQITRETDLSLISGTGFQGRILIHLPTGALQDSHVCNCTISGPVDICSTGLLKGYCISSGVVINGCGRVIWDDARSFLNGSLQLGLETGERAVVPLPDMNHIEAYHLATAEGRGTAAKIADDFQSWKTRQKGIIACGARLKQCCAVENTIILEGASIDAAVAVKGSLLLPDSQVTDGALVRNSVLQWKSHVDSMAVVEDSIVGECAVVEKHAALNSSFLGADSVLGQGEITASLAGPLTGMHHHSLLIAALWPGGRGNIGYGANVGSNHTSRMPDQEIRPGTGMFFGLGTSIKFPADFSGSPYSVIATGVVTQPQKVSYPFSLIMQPAADHSAENIQPGWCRLLPGWMLYANLYSVLRNAWKYSRRSRAENTSVETAVFTDEIRNLVADALARLESTSGNGVEGAGKNYILQRDIDLGKEAYRDFLRTAELLELTGKSSISAAEIDELRSLLEKVREKTESSRLKDWRRGSVIIEDYSAVRSDPADDPFLNILCKELEGVEENLRGISGNSP